MTSGNEETPRATARTLVSVERGAGEPVYRQLRKALEHEIASGALDARHEIGRAHV